MPAFKRWSDDSVAPLSGLLSPERQLECARSRVEMQRYMAERCRERETDPRDDLLSDLVQARFDSGERAGEQLSMPELLNVIEQLLVAGNETTTKLIAAGMLALLEHPAQMAAVLADRSLIPNLVEEALRYESPVQMLPRVAKVDVEVGGVAVPAGSILMMMYGCEARIAFELLFDRCADWALDTSVDAPTHRELSMTLRGLSALHLTCTPAQHSGAPA
jgi:cytochrome P450